MRIVTLFFSVLIAFALCFFVAKPAFAADEFKFQGYASQQNDPYLGPCTPNIVNVYPDCEELIQIPSGGGRRLLQIQAPVEAWCLDNSNQSCGPNVTIEFVDQRASTMFFIDTNDGSTVCFVSCERMVRFVYANGEFPPGTWIDQYVKATSDSGNEITKLVSFNVGTFGGGSDPPPPPPPPSGTDCGSPDGTWNFCANEGEECIFSGSKTVRYGANDTYTCKEATESITCNNFEFGDPIEGVYKHCDYFIASVPTSTPTQIPATTSTPTPLATQTPTPTLSPTPTPIPDDYDLSCSNDMTVNPGDSGSSLISATTVSGSPGPVTLSVDYVDPAIDGTSYDLSPNPITPDGFSALTLFTDSTTASGTYTIHVTGTTGGTSPIVRSTTCNLIVNGPTPTPTGPVPTPTPTSIPSWLEVTSGNIHSKGNISAQWAPPAGEYNGRSLITSDGTINANFTSETYTIESYNSNQGRYTYNYAYFEKLLKDKTTGVRRVSGTVTTSTGNFGDSEKEVVLVDGNLVIDEDFTPSNVVIFIVKGNIVINADVSTVYAGLVADGTISD